MMREIPRAGRHRLTPVDVPAGTGAVTAVADAVDALATDPTQADDPMLDPVGAGADLLVLLRAQAQLSAAIAARTATFDAADAGTAFGLQFTTTFLACYSLLDVRAAGRLRHTGHDTLGPLRHVGDAWRAGRIGEAHVAAIRSADQKLAGRLGDDPAAQATVVDYAQSHTATELQLFLRMLVDQYTSDGSDAEEVSAFDRRYFSIGARLDGWSVDGFLDPATGTKLQAFLAECATKCGPDDIRTAAQRRADALGEALDLAAGSPSCAPGVQVTVTVTAAELSDHSRIALTAGLSVAGRLAALFTCGASVDLMIVNLLADGRQVPLRMGRTARLATAAQRRALAVRDRRCIHHGCTRTPRRCHAHHINEWENGGATDLANLVLLCPYHHAMLHLGRFRIVADPDHPGCFICVYPDRHTSAA